jgi:hypothetical protein
MKIKVCSDVGHSTFVGNATPKGETTNLKGGSMSNFFPMPRGDRWFLAIIIVFSIISFLPWTQGVHVAGMALFGWLMAALMILSPAIALIRLIRHRVSQRSADILVRDKLVD